MKKILSLVLVLCLILSLSACNKKTEEPKTDNTQTSSDSGKKDDTAAKADGYEIALVTDVGNIDDKSFNQGAWEGVKKYAEDNKKTYNYYRPSEDSTEARVETIKQAIDKGAKVVVCPGYLFEDAIYEVQDAYSSV